MTLFFDAPIFPTAQCDLLQSYRATPLRYLISHFLSGNRIQLHSGNVEGVYLCKRESGTVTKQGGPLPRLSKRGKRCHRNCLVSTLRT